MNSRSIKCCMLGLAAFSLISQAWAEEQLPHWNYDAIEAWADHPAYASCGLGKKQAPINIVTAQVKKAALPAIETHYQSSAAEVVHNGHTVQVNLAAAGFAKLKQGDYRLLQFHFHTPSGEAIDGKHYPMVAHLVHQNADGQLAVMALLIEAGKASAALQPVFASLPAASGERQWISAINVSDMLPDLSQYYAFNGSLTTPPCSEGVSWYVVQQALTLSAAQIQAFKKIFNHNSRPIQPLNGRVVEQPL